MSEEQLSALLAKLKEDTDLREKLQGAGELDAVVAMANAAGFNVRKADWLRYQAKQILALSDAELESIAGSRNVTAGIHCDSNHDTCIMMGRCANPSIRECSLRNCTHLDRF